MIALAVVVAVVLIAAAVGAVWWFTRRTTGTPPGASLEELVRQAEGLPPSPTRTVIRLRVELRESTAAAEVATIASRGGSTDLTATMARLDQVSSAIDADLAALAARPDAAIGPVVPALRARVREAQGVADRVVVLGRDAAAGAERADLVRLHDELDHELRILDAHRELGEG
ncbi:MAG: hypothetical protein AAGA17_14840 [Actinomycetota bacterium]